MSQKVQAVKNPNFTVPPLTTISGSIVSRRRVKVPVNNPGDYGGIRSKLRSMAQFDLASSEDMVDLLKLVLCCDIQVTDSLKTGSMRFDQSSQALIAKLQISTSQGMIIETIDGYATFANAIQQHTESSSHKQMTVLDYSNYDKRVQNCSSSNTILDSSIHSNSNLTAGGLTQRLHIRFHHSSFINRVRFLPLFCFRNGLRFEVTFQDPNMAFVYETHVDEMITVKQVNVKAATNQVLAVPAFFVGAALTSGDGILTGGDFDAKSNVRFADANLVNMPGNNLGSLYVHSSQMPYIPIPGTSGILFPITFEDATSNEPHTMKLFWLCQGTGPGLMGSKQGVTHTTRAADGTCTVPVDADTDLVGGNENYYHGLLFAASSDGGLHNYAPNLIRTSTGVGNSTYLLKIDIGSGRYCSLTVNDPALQFISHEPNVAMLQHPILFRESTKVNFQYVISNPELLVDMVKPAASDFLEYQKAFQSPSGIPYMFKRIMQKSRQLPAIHTGFQQISVDFAVRSLSGLIVVFQLPECTLPTGDNTKALLPCLSSFMRRGLTQFEVMVGGQRFPSYQLEVKPRQSDDSVVSTDFLVENENFFGLSGSGSFSPSFTRLDATKNIRNYAACGDYNLGLVAARNIANDVNLKGLKWGCDTSSFVIAMSLCKDDVLNFATGLDSSQSGMVQLNFTFGETDPLSPLNRPVDVHIWAVCDAIFTLQNDANLVRY